MGGNGTSTGAATACARPKSGHTAANDSASRAKGHTASGASRDSYSAASIFAAVDTDATAASRKIDTATTARDRRGAGRADHGGIGKVEGIARIVRARGFAAENGGE